MKFRIAEALANFQRGIIANNSPFDEYMRGNQNALTEDEIEGMNTFIEVGCANCHSGPMFSDFELHTLSVPDHPLVNDDGATGAFDFRTPSLRKLSDYCSLHAQRAFCYARRCTGILRGDFLREMVIRKIRM